MNNKGVSEIISQILLMLVTVVVVGIIIAAIVPQISRGKSQIKFEESKLLRDNLYSNIQEVYNSPIGYTKEISLKLENLSLNIDGDTETIEIYSIIDGEFYKDGLRQEEGNGKYTYRNGQKLYAGFTLENIDIVRSYVLENQLNATIYLRKTDKDKITILLENVIEDHWFAASNLGLYTENPSTWQYRKKILIDGKKVDGNLTNFPALIYLNDFDLNLYAKSDGSDIIFTSKDGKTKLKREIEDYNSNSGALIAWVKIPELTTGADTPIYMYFGNSDANESNDKDVWDDDYVLVNHLNEDLLDSTIIGKQFYNSNATLTTGKINNSFYFDGAYTTKMNTEISEFFNLSNSDLTMSGWFYIPSSATQVSWGGLMIGGGYTNGIDLTCGRVLSGTGAPLYISFTSSVPRDTWYYLTLVHSLSEKKGTVYFNGDYKAEDTYPDTLPTTNKIVYLAVDQIHMTGRIDEVKISKISRSAEWIKTEYTNQSIPEEFIKIGVLEKA